MHYIYIIYTVGVVQYCVDTIQILGLQIRIIIFPVNGYALDVMHVGRDCYFLNFSADHCQLESVL